MTGPPANQLGKTDNSGLIPEGTQKPAKNDRSQRYVYLVNPYHGDHRMRRKDAEYYVADGRAEWLDEARTRLRLLMLHPKNKAAAERIAVEWEALIPPDANASKLSHAIASFPHKFKGLEHRASRFVAPPKRVVHPPGSDRIPDSLCRPDKPKSRGLRHVTLGARVSGDLLTKWPLTKKDVAALKDAASRTG